MRSHVIYRPSSGWGREWYDEVFFDPSVPEPEVVVSLIDHDGYPSDIFTVYSYMDVHGDIRENVYDRNGLQE